MSVPALLELNEEINRLAVAGANLAGGDFRVKRLIPALRKSGEAVPVFARAAELAERLTADGEPDRAARLLELANLVNAVLAALGPAGAEGDFEPLAGCEAEFGSFLPHSRLKALEDALARGASGRMETLKEAAEDGAFRDFRLAAPLVRALSDGYAELADFAAERLAGYGGDIVPYLKRGFDAVGGRPHARRVEAVAMAAGPVENDWYRSVAETGDGPVKAAAVYALCFLAENEEALLSHTFDRRKEVREAAFRALGGFGSEAVSKRFAGAFDGRDRSAAMAGLSLCPSAWLSEHLMRRADEALASLVKSGKVYEAERKKAPVGYADADAAMLSDALEALRYKAHPDLLAFYASMERSAAPLTWLQARPETGFGTVARQWACNLLYLGAIRPDGSADAKAGPPERFALLDGLLGRFGNYFIDFAFAAAAVSLSPAEVFERYAPVLKAGRGSEAAGALTEVFLSVARYAVDVPVRDRYALSKSVDMLRAADPLWDPRWLDAFIDIDAGELAARAARKGHRRCGEYLASRLENALRNPSEEGGPWPYVAGLVQMEHPKAVQLALHALEKRLAAKDYLPKYDAAVLRLLPGDCAGRIVELAAQYDDRALADIAEQVGKNPESGKRKRFGLF